LNITSRWPLAGGINSNKKKFEYWDFFFKFIFIYVERIFFKIFNKKSIIKIFIIFIVGFVIIIIVNYAYNINVFINYTNMISIFYHYFMALFVVVINQIITQFQFPFSSFFSYVFSVVKKLSFVNLDDLKLSF
jgi:hypothetical protein